MRLRHRRAPCSVRLLSLAVACWVPNPSQAEADSTAAGAVVTEGSRTESIVTLVTGDSIRGVIVESNPQEIVLAHPILGRLVVPRGSVDSIRPVQAPATPTDAATGEQPAGRSADAQVPEPAAPTPPADTAAATPVSTRRTGDPPRPAWAAGRIDLLQTNDALPAPGIVEWQANIQAALAGVSSDNDELNLRTAGALVRLTHTDKWASSLEYFLSLLNGTTTDNNLLATSVYDYLLLPTDWLAFGKLQYQYDQFQSWEHRLSGYAGLGYRLLHERPLAMTVKGGFGATHEFSGSRQTTPEAYAEVALAWWIDERQTLEASVNMAPDLTDWGDYRILARLDWILRLSENGVGVVGGVRNEYQSSVPPGGTNNDLRYYLGIRYDF